MCPNRGNFGVGFGEVQMGLRCGMGRGRIYPTEEMIGERVCSVRLFDFYFVPKYLSWYFICQISF